MTTGCISYVVAEAGVRNRHENCCVRQVNKAIVGVLANGFVARQVAVVDPYVG